MAIKETNDEIKIIANTMTAGNINPAVVEILPTTTGDISILASVANIDSAVAPVTTAISAKDLYDVLPTNHVLSIAKLSNNYANNNKELPDMKGKLKSNIYDTGYEVMYKSPSQEFTIKFENFAPSKKSINFRKTLNYLWIEANKQNYNERIVFSLEDYQKKMGYASKDIAYKALKKCRDELMKMSITNSKFKYSKKNKKMKETVSSKMRIFYGGKVSYTNCVIMANAELMQSLPTYISVLPTWTCELCTKAYDLIDYIYTQCRQEANQKKLIANGKFNISLQAINTYICGFEPNETPRHNQLIIQPILNALKEVEATKKSDEIKITIHHVNGYKNVGEFLKGYIEIEMDEYIIRHVIQLNEKRIKLQKQNSEIKKLKEAKNILKLKQKEHKNNI